MPGLQLSADQSLFLVPPSLAASASASLSLCVCVSPLCAVCWLALCHTVSRRQWADGPQPQYMAAVPMFLLFV